MNICVVHPRASFKSAKRLAVALQCEAFNPFKMGSIDFTKYDVVVNYGVSLPIKFKAIVNHPAAVLGCVNKLITFRKLKAVGVPTVAFAQFKKDVPASWETVVCREVADGHSNKGMSYVNSGEPFPDSALYTEYYDHKFEFRIVVLKGKVVGRYLKEENKSNEWEFNSMDKTGFGVMDTVCTKAAAALGIDFVGFDVLANSQNDFRILEANSGPIMTHEVLKAMKKEFANA